MAGTGSQKLDIAEICDSVAGSDGMKADLAALTAAITDDNYTAPEVREQEQMDQVISYLAEMVFHLRSITGENPGEC
jgi:uncharacterized protein YggE